MVSRALGFQPIDGVVTKFDEHASDHETGDAASEKVVSDALRRRDGVGFGGWFGRGGERWWGFWCLFRNRNRFDASFFKGDNLGEYFFAVDGDDDAVFAWVRGHFHAKGSGADENAVEVDDCACHAFATKNLESRHSLFEFLSRLIGVFHDVLGGFFPCAIDGDSVCAQRFGPASEMLQA